MPINKKYPLPVLHGGPARVPVAAPPSDHHRVHARGGTQRHRRGGREAGASPPGARGQDQPHPDEPDRGEHPGSVGDVRRTGVPAHPLHERGLLVLHPGAAVGTTSAPPAASSPPLPRRQAEGPGGPELTRCSASSSRRPATKSGRSRSSETRRADRRERVPGRRCAQAHLAPARPATSMARARPVSFRCRVSRRPATPRPWGCKLAPRHAATCEVRGRGLCGIRGRPDDPPTSASPTSTSGRCRFTRSASWSPRGSCSARR